MSVQLYQVEKAVTFQEDFAYGTEPNFVDHIRSYCARTMAEGILREASVYKRIDPDDKTDPFGTVRHRWSIGIERDPAALVTLESQIDDGRRAGLREAAAWLRAQAERFAHVEGGCKHVLQNQLFDNARALELKANEAKA